MIKPTHDERSSLRAADSVVYLLPLNSFSGNASSDNSAAVATIRRARLH